MKNLAIILLLMLTACSSSLVQLRKVEPQGNMFQIYLAREYLDFAEAEADQFDWFDSTHFAKKGLMSAKGVDVYPEDLRNWDIPNDILPTLIQAREHMMRILASNVSASYPKETAKMQFFYDCWVEQEEEDWQEDHIAYCREHFYDMLDKLYVVTTEKRPVVEYKSEADNVDFDLSSGNNISNIVAGEEISPVVCSDDCIKQREKRTIYFEFNSSKLTDRGKRVISNIIAELKDVEKYEITINGYADRIGSEDYNLKLSKKRAQSVKKMLIEAGLRDESLTLFAFGEARGLLDTADNTAEKENRAVEIVVEM